MTDQPFSTLLYETADRKAYITLNRPERLNAINREMPREIAAAGNSGRESAVSYPAAVEVAIAVGSVAADGTYAQFSPGPEGVDAFAPGVQIATVDALGQVKRRAVITGITAVSINITIPAFFLVFGFDGVLYAMVVSQFVPVVLLIYLMWKNDVLIPLREVIFLPLFALGLAAGVLFRDMLAAFT